MLTKIYHKRNELFEVDFYRDKECTNLIEHLPYAENCKKWDRSNFYIEIEKGDITPITFLLRLSKVNDYFYTTYLPFHLDKVKTLYDITPNLSKYIPENNAVLFLSEDDLESYQDWFPNEHIGFYIDNGKNDEEFRANNIESLISGIADVKKGNITIFLTNGTEAELQKVNKVAKELKEIYGVKEVNVFVLHCWDYYEYRGEIIAFDSYGDSIEWELYKTSPLSKMYPEVISKLITTNSTGILEIQNKDNLQVIDCYDIFNDYLQNKND
jgi:hypothetical protein